MKHGKRYLLLSLALVLAVALAGCSAGQTKPSPTPEVKTVTCTVAIDCQTAVDGEYDVAKQVSDGGVILPQTEVTVAEGTTVYDALLQIAKEKNIPVTTKGSGDMTMVESINSLGSKDCGAVSYTHLGNGSCAEGLLYPPAEHQRRQPPL